MNNFLENDNILVKNITNDTYFGSIADRLSIVAQTRIYTVEELRSRLLRIKANYSFLEFWPNWSEQLEEILCIPLSLTSVKLLIAQIKLLNKFIKLYKAKLKLHPAKLDGDDEFMQLDLFNQQLTAQEIAEKKLADQQLVAELSNRPAIEYGEFMLFLKKRKNNFFINLHLYNGKLLYTNSVGKVHFLGPKRSTLYGLEELTKKTSSFLAENKINYIRIFITSKVNKRINRVIKLLKYNYPKLRYTINKVIKYQHSSGLRLKKLRRV